MRRRRRRMRRKKRKSFLRIDSCCGLCVLTSFEGHDKIATTEMPEIATKAMHWYAI